MALTGDDTLFVDTNVLLTATDELRPFHREAAQLLAAPAGHHRHLAVNGQVLREYLAVATRPADVNGLGLGVRDAIDNVSEFLRWLDLYDETAEVSRRLRELVLTHGLRGRRIHDANIVATMLPYDIRSLVTGNAGDFAPFEDVSILAITDAAA